MMPSVSYSKKSDHLLSSWSLKLKVTFVTSSMSLLKRAFNFFWHSEYHFFRNRFYFLIFQEKCNPRPRLYVLQWLCPEQFLVLERLAAKLKRATSYSLVALAMLTVALPTVYTGLRAGPPSLAILQHSSFTAKCAQKMWLHDVPLRWYHTHHHTDGGEVKPCTFPDALSLHLCEGARVLGKLPAVCYSVSFLLEEHRALCLWHSCPCYWQESHRVFYEYQY